MATRTLKTAPPPRPAQATEKPAHSRKRTRTSPHVSSTAGRRVHVTIGRDVAERLRVEAAASSNTEVLIAALSVEIEPNEVASGPFAPRRRAASREGVYFYLAPGEIAHIDGMAVSGGYETRSALIDAALRAHLSI